jgi:hypothetical protein
VSLRFWRQQRKGRRSCQPLGAAGAECKISADDYVILCEDDILFAKDALKFFEWARDAYRDDKDVLSVCSYSRDVTDSTAHHKVKREGWFTPWGWATWADRFADIKAGLAYRLNVHDSWDQIVNHSIRKDRFEIRPLLARTQNIGGEMGTYCPGPEWHRQNQFNEHWAGSLEVSAGSFIEN